MNFLVSLIGLYLTLMLVIVCVSCAIHATAQGNAFRLSRTRISRFFREWMAHAVLVGLLPFGMSRPPAPTCVTGDLSRTPVLLVPGFLMNRATMWILQLYLRRRGWCWVWAINNRRDTPISVMARELGDQVEELKRQTGSKEVDVIAHSMGGIVTAWYATQLNGAPNIRQLISLGTPWKGTRMHIWGVGREARDLAPDAEVIAQAQQPPIPVTAIWSAADQLIVPATYSHCEGKENLQIEQCGHMEMLLSARVFRLIREILSTHDESTDHEPA